MARAICDKEWDGPQPWDRKPESFKNRYRSYARAAYAALAAAPPSAGEGETKKCFTPGAIYRFGLDAPNRLFIGIVFPFSIEDWLTGQSAVTEGPKLQRYEQMFGERKRVEDLLHDALEPVLAKELFAADAPPSPETDEAAFEAWWKSSNPPDDGDFIKDAFLAGRRSRPIPDEMAKLVAKVVLRVCEYDDRTSPEDFPEALLITPDELTSELLEFAGEILGGSYPDQAAPIPDEKNAR